MTDKPGPIYPCDCDCGWLAIDKDDHLGVFVTGGRGPIPVNLLSDANSGDWSVESRIQQLPRVSKARIVDPQPTGRLDSWVEIAERGIFAFDWSDVHRTLRDSKDAYELMVAPSTPITVNQLPPDLFALAQRNRSTELSFTARFIDVRPLKCLEARE